MYENILSRQVAVCRRYGVPHYSAPPHLKVGIAENVKGWSHPLTGLWPLNGLRHPQEGDTTGWFIWAGEELSTAPDFFVPLHVAHLDEWCPEALPFLGLPPGWRFLIAPGYEDVWYDANLLPNATTDSPRHAAGIWQRLRRALGRS